MAATTRPSFGITDCPAEVLEHIFSFLPWKYDLVNVSLVSRLWSELAFSNYNMRRLELKIIVNDIDYKGPLLKKYELLKNSSRRYRKVSVWAGGEIGYISHVNFEMVLSILELFGPTLEYFYWPGNLMARQLRRILIATPNLRSLLVEVLGNSGNVEEDLPVLRHLKELEMKINCFDIDGWDFRVTAPNLEKLSIKFNECKDPLKSLQVLRYFAPDLRTLSMDSVMYFFPIEELRFPKLEVLRLAGHIFRPGKSQEDAQENFLSQFSGLKEASFECPVHASALQSFSRSCPGLKKMILKSALFKSFDFSEGFKQLREIQLNGIIRSEMLAGCKPLPSVVKLYLQMIHTTFLNRDGFRDYELAIERLSTILPNVQEMKVFVEEDEPAMWLDAWLRNFFKSFKRIKRLELHDEVLTDDYNYKVEYSSLEALDQLEELEELSLNCLSLLLAHLAPIGTLRKMKLSCMELNRDVFLSIPKKCPQLQYFEMFRCSGFFNDDDMKLFQSLIPNCVMRDEMWRGK